MLFLAICTPTSEVEAHVIMGKKSLHLYVAESTWVVRGLVTDPQKLHVSPDGSKRRHLVEVRALEVIKGSAGREVFRVAHDGHAAPRYAAGDEAVFFLSAIETSRELRQLAVEGGATHVSSQEHDEAFRIEAPHGAVLLAAIRSFARSESVTKIEERVALIREATLDLITSGDPDLSTTALAGLVLAPHAALVTQADLPRLEKLLADPTTSIGLKAGLIAELERRGFVDGPSHWHGLLEGASPSQLPSAIRAAGAHASEPVRAHLLELLKNPETETAIAAEAAIALGASPSAEVIGALANALDNGPTRLSNAAIRGLGLLQDPRARRVLERAAQAHADPSTRRRAGAELTASAARATGSKAAPQSGQ